MKYFWKVFKDIYPIILTCLLHKKLLMEVLQIINNPSWSEINQQESISPGNDHSLLVKEMMLLAASNQSPRI